MARFRQTIAALSVAAAVVAAPAGRAAAHTDFESSTPADGAVVDAPLSEITISFTNGAEEAGDGFQIFDGDGAVRAPTAVDVTDGRIFTLRFDPPLTPGEIGVRWEVRAGDAHPIDGTFSFTLAAPPPTTPASTAPPATVPTTIAPVATTAPLASAATGPPATSPPATSAATSDSTVPAIVTDEGGDSAPPATTLDDFLAADGDDAGQGRQLVGRVISIPAAILAIGAIAFLASALRGTGSEFGLLLRIAAAAGAALVIGGVLEYLGWAAQSDDSFGSAWTSTPGAAMALRIIAGAAIAAGALAAASTTTRTGAAPRPLSAAVVDAAPVATTSPPERWSLRTAPVLAAGVALVIVSFWFDGHTVSRGPRVVHAIVNGAHVGAAGVWAGGVVAFAAVAWTRHRRGTPTNATELIVRFSTIATIALAIVVVAGAVMTGLVIDETGDLTATEWGRTLLLKAGAVAVAALMGAFNHFRLRPALERSPDDVILAGELRRTLLAEVVVLAFVAIVTAWLVAAAV